MASSARSIPISDRGRKVQVEPYKAAQGIEALGTAGLCIALGIVLPYFVHPFGLSPRILLPMHFPIFLAGLLLSPLHAAIVGVLTPALSMGLTGMPTADQVMRMMPELAAYAAVTSVMIRLLPKIPGLSVSLGRIAAMIVALLVAMIVGRLIYVAIAVMMAGYEGFSFYFMVLISPALPGIIAQFVLVPAFAYRIQKITHKG
jgi:hypothetical protein